MTITGIGETVLDIVFQEMKPQAAVPGGSTFNAMISLGRTVGRDFPEVGLRMVSQIGDDPVGDFVFSFMEENRVGTGAMIRAKGQTTVSMAMLDEHRNAQYEFFRDRGLPRFQSPELAFGPGDIVLFGSFFAINPDTREQTRALIREARAAGATVYYDINFRKSHDAATSLPEIEKNMALSDIVRGSSEDIEALYGSASASDVYERHIAPLCKNFICTNHKFNTLNHAWVLTVSQAVWRTIVSLYVSTRTRIPRLWNNIITSCSCKCFRRINSQCHIRGFTNCYSFLLGNAIVVNNRVTIRFTAIIFRPNRNSRANQEICTVSR